MSENERRPRQWARMILIEPDIEKRRSLLASAPEHLQALIRKHVEIAFQRARHDKGRK